MDELEKIVDEVLIGIDKTETESEDGWWETSSDAEFGQRKKEELKKELLKKLNLFADANQINQLQKIILERKRQNEKWGEQNHDDYRWLAILMEEVGEVAKASLENEYGGPNAGNLEAELVQVAAVAVQWLEHLQRR